MLPLTSVVLITGLAAAGRGIIGVAPFAPLHRLAAACRRIIGVAPLFVPHSCSCGGRCGGHRFAGAGT
jgi:hypothetical protein